MKERNKIFDRPWWFPLLSCPTELRPLHQAHVLAPPSVQSLAVRAHPETRAGQDRAVLEASGCPGHMLTCWCPESSVHMKQRVGMGVSGKLEIPICMSASCVFCGARDVWGRGTPFESQGQSDPWESLTSSCTHLSRSFSQSHPHFCPFLPMPSKEQGPGSPAMQWHLLGEDFDTHTPTRCWGISSEGYLSS